MSLCPIAYVEFSCNMCCYIITLLTLSVSVATDSLNTSETTLWQSFTSSKRYIYGGNSWEYEFPHSVEKRTWETKCEEYSEALLEKKMKYFSSLNFSNPSITRGSLHIAYRISNGQSAKVGEFPQMVALGWFNRHSGRYIHHCGGTLISEKWILTAAHCTHTFLRKRGVARLGVTKLSDIKSGVVIGVVEIIQHPNYKSPKMYADIALMRLARPVAFDEEIKPACLYAAYDDAPHSAWATGWGVSQFDDDTIQNTLRKVNLEILDSLSCALAYNRTTAIPHGIVPSMLCARDPLGDWKKDTCYGDSGGPLQIFNTRRCLYEVVGITSFGRLCGTRNFPGVYTRVSHYLQWIESIVWPHVV